MADTSGKGNQLIPWEDDQGNGPLGSALPVGDPSPFSLAESGSPQDSLPLYPDWKQRVGSFASSTWENRPSKTKKSPETWVGSILVALGGKQHSVEPILATLWWPSQESMTTTLLPRLQYPTEKPLSVNK